MAAADIEATTKAIFERGRGLDLFDDEAIAETSFAYSSIAGLLERRREGGGASLTEAKAEMVEAAKEAFARSLGERNQYYRFSDEQRKRIGAIYDALIREIAEDASELDAKIVRHRRRLRSVFGAPVEERPCSYYGPELQLALFGIDASRIEGPLLDLGCGPEAALVEHLRSRGVEASGIDLHIDNIDRRRDYLAESSWENLALKKGDWGTIVSHMAFSNHFIYHYLRNDGADMAYARKYREILDSLRPGGSFHYAPSLPFVERHVDPRLFEIGRREVGLGIGVTALRRLRG